jgi:YD repeat-containing protein
MNLQFLGWGMGARVFMTERRDAQGNAVHFTYDQQLRLVAVTDAIGQVTAVAYDLAQDPWKITRVVDPFGRSATFAYDAAGLLQSNTDTIGLQSSYVYAPDGFVLALTTPYGTTRFTKSETDNTRTVDITDPQGARERVEYRATDGTAQDPWNTVPSSTVISFFNAFLQYRNTLYWNKRAMAAGAGDRTKAHLYHWLHAKGNANQTSAVLESEKAPLENRVWYQYPNQSFQLLEGDGNQPTVIARVLDDGTTQTFTTMYNALGYPTIRAEPQGRKTTYSFAPNAIDLMQITLGISAGLCCGGRCGRRRTSRIPDVGGG